MEDTADKFKCPPKIDITKLINSEQPVCVVSLIGKSKQNVFKSKASLFNSVVDMDAFTGLLQHDSCDSSNNDSCDSSKELGCIEGHYDRLNGVVYLHLQSTHDTSVLTNLCHTATKHIQQSGYHSFWQKAEFTFARSLLYLFSVSHIIVLLHPGRSFDVGYVRLFRILDNIRGKLQPSVCDLLKNVGVSKVWQEAGRACSPRVLFVFEDSSVQASCPDRDKTRNQKTQPNKKLQHAIEDQIYRILRKSRVITNISNNSLFAIPANQEFVFVCEGQEEAQSTVDYFLQELCTNYSVLKQAESVSSYGYSTSSQSSSSSPRSARPINSSSNSSSSEGDDKTFKHFIQQHIQLAKTKGFDDNVGRNPVPAVFELPTVGVWFHLSTLLYDFYMSESSDLKVKSHFSTLRSMLEVDTRFSEGRCAKVLPLAESTYQEGLPQHYTSSVHHSKLIQAQRVLRQHARGAACHRYLQQLQEDCVKIWQSGRQLCEDISLTGNHCVHPLHRLTEADSLDSQQQQQQQQQLPVLQHCSQVRVKATCNCGHKQAERDDPFDHKAANFDFYEKLEAVCCGQLEHHHFPVFSPSTLEVREGGTTLPSGELQPPQPHRGQRDSAKQEVTAGVSSLSLALSLGQSGVSDTFAHDAECSQSAPEPVVMTGVQAEPSTTEYLPGMLHSESPPGLLPKFCSWSLLCLGKSSTYNPTHGIEQSGFLHGGSHLLPWDVTVTMVTADKDKWPSITETSSGKKHKHKKGQKTDVQEVSVRLYVGLEYECPRGHRFFCSSPDKILQTKNPAVIKDSAGKLLTSDMPLYVGCHCRSSKGYLGQLMRLFVVIPEGHLSVRLCARVVPGPPPCPVFSPTPGTSVTLHPDAVWVLRFPYIYMGKQGAYHIHSDPQHLSACRLLSGVLSVTEAVSSS